MLYKAVKLRALALSLAVFAACGTSARAQSASDPVYVFHTNLGDMRVQLFPDVTPLTVANFLNYVNSGKYNGSIVHRSAPGFVWQGGGYVTQNNNPVAITANPAVQNEYDISNVRGTIAMAKLGNNPNSATDQWFFNLADNSANLNNQNGGFTVFGSVMGQASLDIMDAIANVPIYNASAYYNNQDGAFDNLPLINYNSANGVQASNFVTISSIAPGWTTTAVSTGTSGSTQLLWTRADGGASFWNVPSSGATAYSATFGPFTGWTCSGTATASGGSTRLLWTNTDGRAGVWTVAANGTVNYGTTYGPYAGWTARALTVGSDNITRLLWTNTDGRASFWMLNASGPTYSATYGPYAGWTANGIAATPDGSIRLLWNNVSGAASFWTVTSGGSASYSPTFGPYAGWTAKGIGIGADSATRLLWTNTDGHMGLWTVAANGTVNYGTSYGPFAGWSAQAVSTGTDNISRVLWTNVDGHASFWSIPSSGSVTYSSTYGPY